jgi:putative redox protein
MMKNRVNVLWTGDMSFDAEVNDHHIVFDADEMVGGKNKGPRPKAMLLAGLAGCTGMDVVSILRKMRIEPDYFNMYVEANLTEEHPRVYDTIHLVYEFRGDELPMEKLEKAVELSQERYCGVSAMLGKVAELTWEIKILD